MAGSVWPEGLMRLEASFTPNSSRKAPESARIPAPPVVTSVPSRSNRKRRFMEGEKSITSSRKDGAPRQGLLRRGFENFQDRRAGRLGTEPEEKGPEAA